jgi:hypothetical protein
MVERAARSATGSALRRWGRRLLLVAAAGTGVWLLGCLAHQPSAQAEPVFPRPVPAVSGPLSSLVPPVGSVLADPAERPPVAVVRPVTRGLVPDVPVPDVPVPDGPVLSPVGRAVGSALLPPARSAGAGVAVGSAGQQAAVAHRPGSRPVPARAVPVVWALVRPDAAAERAPHPHPWPAPGRGIPPLPAGDACQTPGSPHSLPLAEPVPGPAFGPAAGLAAPRVVGAAVARQRAYLPDTPPD